MAYLNRDGVKIYYEVHGDRSRGAAQPRLQRNVGDVDRPGRRRCSASHKLIIWDMRGHGNSDSPDDPAAYSEALTTADMAALLDAADAPTAVIGGLSLGGYMSLVVQRRRTRIASTR